MKKEVGGWHAIWEGPTHFSLSISLSLPTDTIQVRVNKVT